MIYQKKNLIEAGKYMNIRGKSYTLKHMEILKISQSYILHGGPGESCYDFSFHQSERLKDSLYVIMMIKEVFVAQKKLLKTKLLD